MASDKLVSLRIEREEIWAALNSEVLRADAGVIEVNMERCRNEGEGETGDPRENPPTSGIVRHDSHLRKSGDLAGDWARFALVGGGRANRSATLSYHTSTSRPQTLKIAPGRQGPQGKKNLFKYRAGNFIGAITQGAGASAGEILARPNSLTGLEETSSRLSLRITVFESGRGRSRIFARGNRAIDDAAGRWLFSGISRFTALEFQSCSVLPSFCRHRRELKVNDALPSSLRGRVASASDVADAPLDCRIGSSSTSPQLSETPLDQSNRVPLPTFDRQDASGVHPFSLLQPLPHTLTGEFVQASLPEEQKHSGSPPAQPCGPSPHPSQTPNAKRAPCYARLTSCVSGKFKQPSYSLAKAHKTDKTVIGFWGHPIIHIKAEREKIAQLQWASYRVSVFTNKPGAPNPLQWKRGESKEEWKEQSLTSDERMGDYVGSTTKVADITDRTESLK
ncbi:hypothetical protein PR048_025426 [Dryococelus australis]|uniref:Uncharacterized protein n=1 Tax=Dryococelus australis TaxID=614101 RepID=A0ABQ9GRB6_9NEOP|nr:hypothetical protein PR048_025426 [Dryococelus australis]